MTEPYTPSPEEVREYVETGGEPRPWVELDDAELARERFRAEAFDRMIEAVRDEEREKVGPVLARYEDRVRQEEREAAAQIAESESGPSAETDAHGRRIAARIREQGKEQRA